MIDTHVQTRMPKSQKPVYTWLPALFMILFFGLGFIAALVNPSTFTSPEGKSIIKGEWTSLYEKEFDKALGFRQFAIDAWGIIEYGLFKQGREGVLVGKDGWLFTNEEFLDYSDSATAFQEKVSLAIKAKEVLAEQGINFVVAVIPAKARVYPEFLGRYKYPSYKEAVYQTFIATLKEKGISVVSLLEPLQEAKQEQAVFLKTDTHWTPFGASIAAQTISNYIDNQFLLPSFDSSDFETSMLGDISHKGDLLSYLPLGNFQEKLGPKFDDLAEQVTEKNESGLGLFGDETIPVTLVGTSYSANELWNFAGYLKQELGADVLNMADEGQGPVVPLETYLESQELKDNPPELVIWEVPERFLELAYSSKVGF